MWIFPSAVVVVVARKELQCQPVVQAASQPSRGFSAISCAATSRLCRHSSQTHSPTMCQCCLVFHGISHLVSRQDKVGTRYAAAPSANPSKIEKNHQNSKLSINRMQISICPETKEYREKGNGIFDRSASTRRRGEESSICISPQQSLRLLLLHRFLAMTGFLMPNAAYASTRLCELFNLLPTWLGDV